MTDKEKVKTYDDDLTDKELITQLRTYMFLAHPFYASLMTRMKWVQVKTTDPTDPKFIPTAATDGKNIFYNMDFFRTLPPKERVFVIAHEIMHCITDSLGRGTSFKESREKFSHLVHNYATDYAINQILKKDNIGELPQWCLQDDKFAGKVSEEIYEIIEKDVKEMKVTFNPETGRFEDENGQSLTDVHLEEMSEADKGKFKDAILEAYQQAKMAGKMPGETETLIQEMLEPKIDWRKVLQISVQSIFKNDMSWLRPNRRSIDGRVILPSLDFQDVPDICLSIDTSGSISEEDKKEFLSEIYGILKYYSSFKLTIWCFDTKVHAFKEYSQTNIKDLVDYKMKGGGGTDIKSNFEFMKEKRLKPKQFICFTDGYNYNEDWGDAKYCPTTWLIYDNPGCKVPFGKYVNYDN